MLLGLITGILCHLNIAISSKANIFSTFIFADLVVTLGFRNKYEAAKNPERTQEELDVPKNMKVIVDMLSKAVIPSKYVCSPLGAAF